MSILTLTYILMDNFLSLFILIIYKSNYLSVCLKLMFNEETFILSSKCILIEIAKETLQHLEITAFFIIIGAPKCEKIMVLLNYYFYTIAIAIFDFSLLLLEKLSLFFRLIFGICSLLLFLISFPKLSLSQLSLFLALRGDRENISVIFRYRLSERKRVLTIWEIIQKRNH